MAGSVSGLEARARNSTGRCRAEIAAGNANKASEQNKLIHRKYSNSEETGVRSRETGDRRQETGDRNERRERTEDRRESGR